MAREAVIVTANGSLKRFGREGFATSDDFNGAAESVVALNNTTVLVPGVLRKHHKVVALVLTEMTQGEKDTVDLTIPTVIEGRHQVVVTDRNPDNNDDISKGFFEGASWFNTVNENIFLLQDNGPKGSAIWLNVTASGIGFPYMQVVTSTNHAMPTSAALIPYDTLINEDGGLFTFDNAGTLTATLSGKVLFYAESNIEVLSGSTMMRGHMGLYESTGGAYSLIAFSESRDRISSVLTEDVFSIQIPHDVASGNTYQVHLWKDDGTANGTATAERTRLLAYLLEAA